MMERTPTNPDDKKDALLQRQRDLEDKLAQVRQERENLQEAALMLVPQHLLDQVNGGTVQDFKNVLGAMQNGQLTDLRSVEENLNHLESALDSAEKFFSTRD